MYAKRRVIKVTCLFGYVVYTRVCVCMYGKANAMYLVFYKLIM